MSDEGKVTDIYFLTQLTPDEKVSMVRLPKSGSLGPQPLLVVSLDHAQSHWCSCLYGAV